MSYNIDFVMTVVDKASAATTEVANKIEGSMQKVENATKQVDEANKKADFSAKDLAVGFSGVATAGFGLYMTIDRVEKSQFALQKANLAVERSNESVEAAQKNYNTAVEKFGAVSGQAKDASDKLRIAQDAHALAVERVGLAEGNVTQAMVQGALTVIPSVITMVSSLSSIRGILSGITSAGAAAEGVAATAKAASVGPTAALTGASWALNASLLANPLVWIVVAIAAFVAAVVLAYTQCEPFRNAINAIGEALGKYLGPIVESIKVALSYLWENVLVPLGNFIYSTFVAYVQALVAVFQWLANVLLPVTDAVWGFFAGCNDAIGAAGSALAGFTSWFGGAVSGLCSAVVETVASMTGQSDALTEAWAAKSVADVNSAMDAQLASVRSAYEQQTATIDEQLQQQLTAIDAFYATLQADAKTAFDAQYADFLNFYQAQLEPAQETELQKLVDKWTEHFDKEIADMNGAYNQQISETNAFYDSLIDAANVKLSAIRDARKADLDDLELNNLLQKQALKLAFDEGELSTEAYNKAVADLDKNYNGLRKDINDDYRLKELRAEKTIKEETVVINTERTTVIAGIEKTHVDALTAKEQEKSDKIVEINNKDKALREEYANTVAKLEQDKANETNVVIEAVLEAKKVITQVKEDQEKGIIEKAEAEKQRLIKESQDKISTSSGSWFDGLTSAWSGFTDGIGTSWKGLCDGLSSWWSGASSAISTSVGGFCAGVTDWFNGLSAAITGGSIWPDMLKSMVGQANSGLGSIAKEFKVGLGLVQDTVRKTDFSAMGGNLEKTGREIGGTMDEIQKQYTSSLKGMSAKAEFLAVARLGQVGEVATNVAAPTAGVRDTLMRAIGGSERPTVSIQISGPLVSVEGSADRATAELAASMVQESLRNVIVEASSSGAPSTSKMIRYGNKVAI